MNKEKVKEEDCRTDARSGRHRALTTSQLSEIFDTIRKSLGKSIQSMEHKRQAHPFSWLAKLKKKNAVERSGDDDVSSSCMFEGEQERGRRRLVDGKTERRDGQIESQRQIDELPRCEYAEYAEELMMEKEQCSLWISRLVR
ncbi:hypothetical protein WN51_12356 [Melipona quadrifasciata]|uniref:Uncharacterized protein n=1 Tax=Melipona quadrifasciata TaxID=166423 RepID=A0A0M9A3V8_9HYME|nr:hypothetical protein WN51_12356 [Melipona quadrifasciata]